MPQKEPIDYSSYENYLSIKANIQGDKGIWNGQVKNGQPHGKGLFIVETPKIN